MEGTLTVFGGSVCDARLQRYKHLLSFKFSFLNPWNYARVSFCRKWNRKESPEQSGPGKNVFLDDSLIVPTVLTLCSCTVAQVGRSKECVRLQLSVLDWNTAARDFYKSRGAEDLTDSEGWHVIRFMDQSLENLANEAPKD